MRIHGGGDFVRRAFRAKREAQRICGLIFVSWFCSVLHAAVLLPLLPSSTPAKELTAGTAPAPPRNLRVVPLDGLAWDPNTDPDLAGYRLYYGAASGTYGPPLTLGRVTTYSLSGLGPGTYYFAVTAYNATGEESGYSNEVSIAISGSRCDINHDGRLDVLDLQLLVTVVNGTNPCPGNCDINYDGRVDAADIQVLADVITGIRVCPNGPASNPAPVIASLSPNSALVGGPAFTLTVTGSSFVSSSSVLQWNGSNRATTVDSSTQLRAAIHASDIASQGVARVSVVNPPPGGGLSSSVDFSISPPEIPTPVVADLNPRTAIAGGPTFSLKVQGSGFLSGVSSIAWNGVALPTTFVDTTQLSAEIDAARIAFPGTVTIAVVNASPSGGIPSNPYVFAINPPSDFTPGIEHISPATGFAGGPPFSLLVWGFNFLPESSVRWNGSNRFTTFLSSRLLRAVILASDIVFPGQNSVTVSNPGGLVSKAVPFALGSAPPFLSAINPPAVLAGSPDFTITIYGLNFLPGATIQWNGSPRQTGFVSSFVVTTVAAARDVAEAGTANLTVVNPDGSRSASQSLQILSFPPGTPNITGLSPDPILSGGAGFTLTVRGSAFITASKVLWNGRSRETRFIHSGELQAEILADDIATAGVFVVTVSNPASSQGATPLEFTGGAGETPIGLSTVTNPVPIITRISPSSAPAEGNVVAVTIEGQGFVQGSTFVEWNTRKAICNYLGRTQISANLATADIAAEGTINFVVSNPPPGGGTSDSHAFTVTPAKPTPAQLYYPWLRSSTGPNTRGENTGFAIVNLSQRDAAITIRAFDTQGREFAGPGIANPVSLSIASLEQRAITESQLFGPGMQEQSAVGWMKLESSESKVAGFFLVFDNSLSTLDGADVSAATLSSFIFPEIEDRGSNRFHIANPGAALAKITFQLYKSDGSQRTSPVGRDVNGNGAIAVLLNELFPGVAPAASDYLRVTSDRGVVPFAHLSRQEQDAEGLNGQDAAGGSLTLYSPQYVVGGPDWATTMSIVNLDTGEASVSLRLIGDDGKQIGATKVLPIAGRGKLLVSDQKFFVDAGDQLTQGYVEIKSSGARLAGSVVFGDPQRGKYASALPLVSSLANSIVFCQVASGMVGDKVYFTGIAMLNPSDADARVTMEVFDRSGRLIGSKTEAIQAHRRKSQLLTEYFTDFSGRDLAGGYIKITADRGLASFALFGSRGALSAVPAQIIP
jgi:hypothetical protein